MSGELKGALLAELIVVLHALGFFLYFGFGPTPRDFHSSWEFAIGVAMNVMIFGTVLAVPFGGFVGAFATRVKRHRVLALIGAALGCCVLGMLVLRAIVTLTGLGLVLVSACGLAVLAALILERWTRPLA